jgi:hypothetical protein
MFSCPSYTSTSASTHSCLTRTMHGAAISESTTRRPYLQQQPCVSLQLLVRPLTVCCVALERMVELQWGKHTVDQQTNCPECRHRNVVPLPACHFRQCIERSSLTTDGGLLRGAVEHLGAAFGQCSNSHGEECRPRLCRQAQPMSTIGFRCFLLSKVSHNVIVSEIGCGLTLIECRVRCSVERKWVVHSGTVSKMQMAANPACYTTCSQFNRVRHVRKQRSDDLVWHMLRLTVKKNLSRRVSCG